MSMSINVSDSSSAYSSTIVNRILRSPKTPYRIAPSLLGISLLALLALKYDGNFTPLLTSLPALLLKDCVYFCLLSIGASLVIATSQFDLSSIGLSILCGTIYALILSYLDLSTLMSVMISCFSSLFVAISSGLVVAYCFTHLKAPLLILTWALGSLYIVLAIFLTSLAPPSVLHDVSGISLRVPTPNDFWSLGGGGFFVCTICIISALLMPTWTSMGDRARAVGSGEASARYAGVNVVRTYYHVFLFNSFMSGLSGIINSYYLNRASTGDHRGQELVPIAIAVLGGTSLAGGHLSVLSVVMAAFFWTCIRQLGPGLPVFFPFLGNFQAEIGQVIFFTIFIAISLMFGRLLGPRLARIFARQEI